MKAPESLKNFLNNICALKPVYKEFKQTVLSTKITNSVQNKKEHELNCLTPLIKEVCDPTDLIVDIGTGLVITVHSFLTTF